MVLYSVEVCVASVAVGEEFEGCSIQIVIKDADESKHKLICIACQRCGLSVFVLFAGFHPRLEDRYASWLARPHNTLVQQRGALGD